MTAACAITRREVLAATGSIALGSMAGCTDLLGGEPVTVRYSLGEVGGDPLTRDAEHELDHGSYFTDGFEIVETTEISYTVEVLDGPNVNVFVLAEDDRDAFADNEPFEAVEGSISLDVSFTEQPGIELDPGEYALIIYNGDDDPENA